MAASVAMGCHRTKHHDANVEISRISVVEKEDQGGAASTDVEINYTLCPGDQIEVVRGGAEFSQCVARLKVGDRVPVRMKLHVAYERDMPLDRGGLVQELVYTLVGISLGGTAAD